MYYVLDKYIGEDEIPRDDLKDLVERSAGTFRHPDVTPVTVGVDLGGSESAVRVPHSAMPSRN
eukprot:scaffold1605_cov242-Pinguiococcus_pyrenoidosus.AAC.3